MVLSKYCGFKVGMTQLFDEVTKQVIPVTALQINPLTVLRKMVSENGVVLALGRSAENGKKEKILCHLTFGLGDVEKVDAIVGSVFDLSSLSLNEGDSLVVSGYSRGHGFQGVMKRHGFAGGPGGHGSNFHRQPGCSGSIRSTGKVFKGRRMPGRMGFDKVTVKGLTLIKIDKALSCIFVKGAVPGRRLSLVNISRAE